MHYLLITFVVGYYQVVGIPGFVDGKMLQLSRQFLRRMNLAQLQVVVNDLHTQIEGNMLR